MKKIILTIILITAVILPAAAIETGGTFSIGNNNLPAVPSTSTAFAGDEYPWGMSLFWKKAANDVSGIDVGFYKDPILNNIIYTNFYYNEDLFNISVGPFFGVFNTAETLVKSGISTSIRVNIPGFAFAQFDTQSTIGGRLVAAGDYIQEANNISLGFYVYNAICTLMINTKSYSAITDAGTSQTEDFTEYAFVTDLFQKNVPYTIALKLAYQNRVRTLESTSIRSLNNVILGTDISVSPFEFLSLIIGLESGLYSFGSLENLVADSKNLLSFASELPGSFLFNATLGVSVDLDNINN
ncbi:MAG TPA: hypothetical protein DCO79_09150 [Spirochaeta sp.]|nr:hypothetical protein [Spirochaeta sp.]